MFSAKRIIGESYVTYLIRVKEQSKSFWYKINIGTIFFKVFIAIIF